MAHELEVINGVASMFSVKETPWHKLGIVLPNSPSVEEAIVLANLNWEVGLKPLVTQDSQELVEALATYRKSDNKILGVVGPSYKPLQNKEAFAFFQPFIDAGLATLETAGVLREGRRVWILAKIQKNPLVIKGNDIVEKYVLLSNSHDGTLAVRVGYSPIRVVCSNTLSMAHNNEASKLIRIKHTGRVLDTLNQVREIMNVADAEFEATAEQYRALANTKCNASDLKKYVKTVLGIPEAEHNTDKGERVLAEVIPLFEKGRGNDMAEIKTTMWAAYNAFNEYLGYQRGRDEGTRVDSLWFGEGAKLNKKALEVATEFAKAA